MSKNLVVAKNMGYIGFLNFSVRLLSFSTTIILIRLLSPYQFGIIALGEVLISIFRNISNFGLNAAIIRKKIVKLMKVF